MQNVGNIKQPIEIGRKSNGNKSEQHKQSAC